MAPRKTEVTREYLETIAQRLVQDNRETAEALANARHVDLQNALDRQNATIEKLFDAKLASVTNAVQSASKTLDQHTKDDERNFRAINDTLSTMKTGMALTRAKVAGIIALIAAVASAVATFVAKHWAV